MTGTRQSATRHMTLDGVRGLAIVAVMALHFTMHGGMAGEGAADGLFRNIAFGGWIGVDVFFVLSGFLITGILVDTRKTDGYYRTFYARRTLRIFPLYYAFLAAMLLLLRPLVSDTSLFADFEGDWWYWTYLTNFWISLEGWPANETLGHLWSLAVDEQFYLIWPFVVASLGARQLRRAATVLVLAGPFIRAGFGAAGLVEAADVNLLSRMDSLALGGLVAMWVRGPRGLETITPLARRIGPLSVIGIIIVWVARGGFDGGDPIVYTGGFSLIAAASAWLIIEAIQPGVDNRLTRLLTNPWLVSLGTYSYGMYVLHGPISIWLPLLFGVDDLPQVLGSQIPAQVVYWAVAMTLSLAAAWVSWTVLEQPFLALKKRFSYVTDMRVASGADADAATIAASES